MPELPEVETIRRQLSQKIVGKKLDGKKIVGVRRRAKILIIDFSDGTSLLFHLKLTGQLIFGEVGAPPASSRFTRHIFRFNDGSQMVFNDARKFGWWKTVKNTKELEKSFGPDALIITLEDFKNRLSRRPNAKIKPLLMDQKFIAGIGNIYSDEILFKARVRPLRIVKTLTAGEIKKVWQNIGKVLKAALKRHGTSENTYVDAMGKKGDYLKYLKVYRKEGKKCFRCLGTVQRIKIGGRSGHFCPLCQK